MPVTPTTKPVSASGTFLVGGDLPVYRLGFSAMRITGPGVWYPVAVGKLAPSDGPLSEIGAEAGATPIQMALAWLLKRSEVMLPIPGTGSVAHRDENLGAAQVALTEDQFRRIDAAVSQAL